MHSVFRLPWCTDQIAPKMQSGKAALESMRASPVMDMAVLNKLKRKRTDSTEPYSSQWVESLKRQRGDSEARKQSPPVEIRLSGNEEEKENAISPDVDSKQISRDPVTHPGRAVEGQDSKAVLTHLAPSSSAPSAQASQSAASLTMQKDTEMSEPQELLTAAGDLTPLQQVIENEFNMQILMKHNELRLIEQELAKCQIALEQLRRCELRPYPGMDQPSLAVSTGKGLSVAPPSSFSRPSHAAPHGVVDGPYTRHYRRWLLNDTQFDSVPMQAAFGDFQSDSRSTRNAGVPRRSVQRSFAVPSPSAEMPKSLPTYPSAPRKTKIALVKRSTDGQLVKLVCNHCHRSDFSNSQGFLNHCRIAHKLDYKSHDQAAIDCGQALDENELANVGPEAFAAPPAKPAPSRSSSTATTPYKPAPTFVHPMNAPGTVNFINSSAGPSGPRKVAPKPVSSIASSASRTSPFTPSAQAPRLSAQFAKYNLGGNLQEAISSAKQKLDLPTEADLSPDASESPSTPATAGARMPYGPPRAGSLAPGSGAARPPSRKGYRQLAQQSRPSPLVSSADLEGMQHVRTTSVDGLPDSPHDRSVNLSPHTVDSNPGLMSDHEDDDQGSASEDEVPQATIAHSLGLGGRSCTDSMDVDVTMEDHVEEDGVMVRRNSLLSDNRGLRMADGSSRK